MVEPKIEIRWLDSGFLSPTPLLAPKPNLSYYTLCLFLHNNGYCLLRNNYMHYAEIPYSAKHGKHMTLFSLQHLCKACSVHPIWQMNKLKMGQFKELNQSHIVSHRTGFISMSIIPFYHVILILIKVKEKFLSHSELIFLCLYSWGLVSGPPKRLSSDLPTTVSISCFLSCSGVGTH